MNEISIVGNAPLDGESVIDIAVDKTPLNNEQAKQLTHSIRDAAEVIWILIARAHAGKAWKALGYDSWEEYVKEEFNMSRSRSYQLLDQAKVITAIEEALPEGSKITMSEAAARELRTVLEEAIPEIRKATENLEGEEAVKVTEEILAKYREKAHADVDPVFDNEGETTDESLYDEDENITIGPAPKESANKLPPLLQPEPSFTGDTISSQPSQATPVDGQPDLAKIRKIVNAAHDIYSSLSALASLPEELEEIINSIPPERSIMVDNNLQSAKDNLDKFDKIWLSKKNTLESNNEN
jgi:hypothetical protein